MGAIGGAALRITSTILRVLELLCGAVALGIFSYFLAALSDHKLPIKTWERAVEGMTGASVLYLLFAVLFTIFLGAHRFFALLAIILDACFIGCYIAVAWLTRGGAGSCSGYVNTPLGSGPSNSKAPGYGANGFGFGSSNVTYIPNLHRACKLETAVFAVSLINIFLFIFTIFFQIMLARHHQKDKKFGPSPANNYTSGVGRRPFWQRKRKVQNTRDAELATSGAPVSEAPIRHSHDTGYTGSTVQGGLGTTEPKTGHHGLYHHQVTGTNY